MRRQTLQRPPATNPNSRVLLLRATRSASGDRGVMFILALRKNCVCHLSPTMSTASTSDPTPTFTPLLCPFIGDYESGVEGKGVTNPWMRRRQGFIIYLAIPMLSSDHEFSLADKSPLFSCLQ